MSNNPNSNNGPRRRRGGRNRSNRGPSSENFTKRTPRIDDRSGLQKFLNTISFGLLCKAPAKQKQQQPAKAPITNTTVVKSPRPEGGQSPRPHPLPGR